MRTAATGKFKAVSEFTDMLGHVTGGAYASIADAVGGAAARATGDMYVTQNCSCSFIRALKCLIPELIAEAKIRHRGPAPA